MVRISQTACLNVVRFSISPSPQQTFLIDRIDDILANYGVVTVVVGKTGVSVELVVGDDVIEGDGDAVDVPVAVGVSVTM